MTKAAACGAGNFALRARRTTRRPCRIFAKQLRIFAAQKYGSERCTDAARTTTARILLW